MLKLKFKMKRMISFLLTAVLLFFTIVTPVNAENAGNSNSNTTIYSHDGYTAEYQIKSSWENNQSINVRITNTGKEPILNWAVKVVTNGIVKELSNAVIHSQEGNSHIIKNAGYNYEIKPDQSINFNYTLTGENLSFPDSIALVSKEKEKQEGYEVSYKVTDDWGKGFQVKATITNNTDVPIEAWKLTFDGNFTIQSMWDAKILNKDDSLYTVGSESWTSPIPANSSLSFGFMGNKGVDVTPELKNFILKEIIIADEIDEEEEIDWSDSTDSDKDGLTDVYEIHFYQTDPKNPDTDGDKLSDGDEILETNTDPLKADTNNNGVTDDLEDPDGDGLTNIKEIGLGTNPNDLDSDGDGLPDGEEISSYKTDPLEYDTDKDGIGDGDEIEIGLDPNNSQTFGIPDSEYTFEQSIDSDKFEDIDYDNLYDVEINITAAGIADESFSVSESPYTDSLQNNDAILGKVIKLEYDEKLKVDSATVNFVIPEKNIGRPTGMYDDPGLADVQRFHIFRYDTKSNLLYPVHTEFDTEKNSLSASVTELGNYLILDLDKWMYNLGISPMTERTLSSVSCNVLPNTSASVSANVLPDTEMDVIRNDLPGADTSTSDNELQNAAMSVSGNVVAGNPENDLKVDIEEPKEPEEIPSDYDEIMQEHIKNVLGINEFPFPLKAISSIPEYNKQIDLVFVIDTSGSMGGTINTCKQKMASLVSDLYDAGITSNVSLVSFEDYRTPIKKYYTAENQLWAKTPAQTQGLINQLGRLSGGAENHIDALDIAKSLPYRPNNQKFMVLITDESIIERYNNCSKSTKTIAAELRESGIVTSVISHSSTTFQPIYEETEGIQTSVYGDFHKYLYAFITGYIQNTDTYTYIGANDLCTRTLKAPIVRNGSTDSDDDGLTDWNETDIQAIDQMGGGPFIDGEEIYVPTFEQYLMYTNLFDAAQFDRINKFYADEIAKLRILPIVSDPMSEDGDEDGVVDKEDRFPLDCTAFNIMKTPQSNSNIGYRFEHSYFFKDNTIFNKELCVVSSIFASVIYENISLLNQSDTSPDNAYIDELMRYHGFDNIVIKKLSDDYSDQHITDVAIGNKKVIYKGETSYIIAIAIRGTNGTVEEWSSNFDIGTSDTVYDNDNNAVPKNSDWTHSENHMGFDIAATRVTRIINDYISSNCEQYTNKVLWITGHSRGAGIANIVGANLSGRYKSFVYTFASPNTTTALNASSFRNIFNIVNQDDIIAELPITDWSFHKYGVTKPLSIGNNYKNEWKELTGNKYKYNTSAKNDLLNLFNTISGSRNACFSYTCDCHGDGSDNGIIATSIQSKGGYPNIVENGKDYCKVMYREDSVLVEYKICQTAAYFMQYLAQVAVDVPSIATNVPKKYEKVKKEFAIYALLGNMHSPHYQETYYLISRRS